MTPLEIEILMHYACKGDDYRNGDHSAPAVKDAIGRFLDEGLLTHEGFAPQYWDDGRMLKPRFAITERTRFYIGALCGMPLPVQVWVMPSNKGERER